MNQRKRRNRRDKKQMFWVHLKSKIDLLKGIEKLEEGIFSKHWRSTFLEKLLYIEKPDIDYHKDFTIISF